MFNICGRKEVQEPPVSPSLKSSSFRNKILNQPQRKGNFSRNYDDETDTRLSITRIDSNKSRKIRTVGKNT